MVCDAMMKRLVIIFLALNLLGARSFSPTSDFLRNTADTPPLTGTPLTFSCWFRTVDSDAADTIFSIGNATISSHYWRIAINLPETSPPNPVEFRTRGSANSSAESQTEVSANTWHHACGVSASDSSRAVYLDGGGKDTSASTAVPTEAINSTVVGARSNLGAEWDGDIAHCAVWNVALSDEECATLAAGVSPLRVHRDGLVAYWPINGHGGSSAEIDIVGGVNLTVNGTPSVTEEPPPFFSPIVAP